MSNAGSLSLQSSISQSHRQVDQRTVNLALVVLTLVGGFFYESITWG